MKRNSTIRTTINALKLCKKSSGKYIATDQSTQITNVVVLL